MQALTDWMGEWGALGEVWAEGELAAEQNSEVCELSTPGHLSLLDF